MYQEQKKHIALLVGCPNICVAQTFISILVLTLRFNALRGLLSELPLISLQFGFLSSML